MITKKKTLILFLGPFSYILNLLAHSYPTITQKYYSAGVYPVIANTIGFIPNLLPFSLAEMLIYGCLVLAAYYFVLIIYRLIKNSTNLKTVIIKVVSFILTTASIVYFIFIIFCGLNYGRPSYINLIGYETQNYSKEELEELCYWIADESNTAKKTAQTDYTTEKMEIAADYSNRGVNVYANYKNPSDALQVSYRKAKPVFASKLMSHANITGVYSPFTFESNINTDIPQFNLPSTILHEMAHYQGFMREEDANFIAFIVGHQSSDPDFVYSSNIMALVHCLNAYYKSATPEEYENLYSTLSQGVLEDLKIQREYWQQFETPVADISEKINDTYLKSNHQPSGVQSYGEMVDSLLAYFLANSPE